MISIFRQYANSLMGGPPASHRFDSTFLLMTGAVFAGYTATAFPPQFLEKFENPLVQFIVFYILGLSTSTSKDSIKLLVIGDAFVTTLLLQLSIYLVNYYYGVNGNENDNDDEK